MLFSKHTIESLLPGECLDDNVVNAFLKIIKYESNDEDILLFESHFYVSLLDESSRCGYVKWALKKEAWMYRIWILPKCQGKHWTLTVVYFPLQTIIHIDSLHGSIDKKVNDRLCSFLQSIFLRRVPFDWYDWTISYPADVPLQIPGVGGGNNCGVHVCVWGYIIFTSDCISFTELDMIEARKWVYDTIYRSANIEIPFETSMFIDAQDKSRILKKYQNVDLKNILILKESPAGAGSTSELIAFLKHMV